MSRLPNGNNPYTNGDRQFDDANQYDSMHQDNRPISVGPEHRVEGYGGFDSGDANLSVPHANDEGISTSTNERFNGVDNGYGSSRHGYAGRNQARWQSTSRDGDGDGLQNNSRTYGNGPGGRQIEGTHRMSPMSLEESLGESKAMFLEAYRVEKSCACLVISLREG